jgi:Tfp pilus assembly protein FimT
VKRKSQRGLTLIELIVAFTILMVLTTMAIPDQVAGDPAQKADLAWSEELNLSTSPSIAVARDENRGWTRH